MRPRYRDLIIAARAVLDPLSGLEALSALEAAVNAVDPLTCARGHLWSLHAIHRKDRASTSRYCGECARLRAALYNQGLPLE